MHQRCVLKCITSYNSNAEPLLPHPFSRQVSFALSQPYHNPSNPSTEIKYQIHIAGLVTLKMYDILGSEAATLVNERVQPEKHLYEGVCNNHHQTEAT